MKSLADIRGQARVIANLERALAQDRVAHAYLFCGPPSCGKHTTGLALAAALNCTGRTHPSAEPSCGECDSCLKIAAANHPDVQTLERQGAAQIIPIETIRRQVIPQLAAPPHEGRARVFLVEEATSLHGPAANALLKTLEEPPPRTHFVLSTTAPDQLLPTIRSRCHRLNFAALGADLRAEIAAAEDQDDDAAARLEHVVRLLWSAMDGGTDADCFAAASDAASERAEIAPALQLLSERLHEDARHAAMSRDLSRASARSRQAARVIEAKTATTLHNAHGQLAIEALLFQLRALAPGGAQ